MVFFCLFVSFCWVWCFFLCVCVFKSSIGLVVWSSFCLLGFFWLVCAFLLFVFLFVWLGWVDYFSFVELF